MDALFFSSILQTKFFANKEDIIISFFKQAIFVNKKRELNESKTYELLV